MNSEIEAAWCNLTLERESKLGGDCHRKVVVAVLSSADRSSPVFKAFARHCSPLCIAYIFRFPSRHSAHVGIFRPNLVVCGTMFVLQNEHREKTHYAADHTLRGTIWKLGKGFYKVFLYQMRQVKASTQRIH